jgi:hypothetical protein
VVSVSSDNERAEIAFGGSNMLHIDKLAERCEDECCTPPPLILSSKPTVDRHPLVREAFRLEWITIGWMVIEAVAAIGSGIVSGSLVLLAFGLDSVIELISAGVLMWRLSVELRHGHMFSENAERIAGRIGGALLFALAAYVVVAAGWNLWTQHHGEFSAPGFIVGKQSPRSGAALYYVISGRGANTVDGKTDAKEPGSLIYEPFGLVHQWGNPGDAPFTFLGGRRSHCGGNGRWLTA